MARVRVVARISRRCPGEEGPESAQGTGERTPKGGREGRRVYWSPKGGSLGGECVRFGKLELDPAENPAVLDTTTWDPAGAWEAIASSGLDWSAVRRQLESAPVPKTEGPVTTVRLDEHGREVKRVSGWGPAESIELHLPSAAVSPAACFVLATLADGQDVLLRLGGGNVQEFGEPIGQKQLASSETLTAYPAEAGVIDRFCRAFRPGKTARALGATPRLGIGTRMTTSVWPGIFAAMDKAGFAANAIQNSVRELNLLDALREGAPPERNFSTGVGMVECGWTGSTYEGLWLAGVLAALKWPGPLRYGADADHVQVKRGADGMERAKRVLRAARYYSFYTLDMADVLDYAALEERSASAVEGYLARKLPDPVARAGVVECHERPFRFGSEELRLDAPAVGRLVGKYWDTLERLEELAGYIAGLKGGVGFDLELTIDEHPPEVAAFDCLTTNGEVLFLAREIERRGLAVTHLAPNFGQEKGRDFAAPDGLEGLERRVRAQFQIASQFGLMLDVHSGDDLTEAPRRVFQRATGGRLHFKVSPRLQILYAEVLQEHYPELFARWWRDALAYAQDQAAQGSAVAKRCLAELEKSGTAASPSWRHALFHSFSFPFVGRRGPDGQFLHRQEFYRLAPAFNAAYQERVGDYLCQLANDLF